MKDTSAVQTFEGANVVPLPNLKALADKFAPEDIEWRIGRAGLKGDGSVWALALAYVTNRAIMDRLDNMCGPENWKNEFKPAPDGGVLCGISIRVGDEWVTKWDGAANTKTEAIKGGLSGSMKRAGVQWGIGRYLYNLPETFVETAQRGLPNYGKFKDKQSGRFVSYTWRNPRLPEWALPEGTTQPEDPPPAMDYEEEPEAPIQTITEAQVVNLMEILESKGWNVEGTLKKLAGRFGASDIASLPAANHDEARKIIVDLPNNERATNGAA